MRLTILFESPFWIGLIELERESCLYVARHVFGAEPNSETVYGFVQDELVSILDRMTTGVPVETAPVEKRVNPKRRQREIQRELAQNGVSSKAHQAMRLQLEQNKQAHEEESRQQREAQRDYEYTRKREKARKKHKGR
jgi:hypothetical protein